MEYELKVFGICSCSTCVWNWMWSRLVDTCCKWYWFETSIFSGVWKWCYFNWTCLICSIRFFFSFFLLLFFSPFFFFPLLSESLLWFVWLIVFRCLNCHLFWQITACEWMYWCYFVRCINHSSVYLFRLLFVLSLSVDVRLIYRQASVQLLFLRSVIHALIYMYSMYIFFFIGLLAHSFVGWANFWQWPACMARPEGCAVMWSYAFMVLTQWRVDLNL